MAALTPSPEEVFPPVLPTGNDYLSLPHVDPATGAIPDLYVVSDRAAGLVGLRGARGGPLLRVVARDAAGGVVPFAPERAGREDDWIPVLGGRAGRLPMTVRIVAPPRERGCVLIVETEAGCEVGVEAHWGETVLAVFRTRPLPVRPQMRWDAWTSSVCGEALGPLPVVGWAVAAEEAPDPSAVPPEPDGGRAALFRRAGRDGRAAFLIAVGAEEDSARTTVVHLRRLGAAGLVAETKRWLRQRRVRLPDRTLAERANLNLLFNRFFATGVAIDTERPRALTSRSPRYYVSGAFWARDALLWSLPGLLVLDQEWAVAVLREVLRSTWPQGAEHALYLHGAHLYPGFELDQLCAYPLAVHQVETAVRGALRGDAGAEAMLRQFPDLLARHFDEAAGLYRTFLDPSDDPPPHPFLTYDNVLAWRALQVCAAAAPGKNRRGWRAGIEKRARALRTAIRRRCIAPGPFGAMYAWATDGRGGHVLYDNPGGSLLQFPALGFCRASDRIWRNTLRWVYSAENAFFVEGPCGGPGNRHAPNPWPLAACHQILSGQRAQGEDFLRRAEMDGGIACETVDAQTGRVRTGGAFATFAGYVGAALTRAGKPRPIRPWKPR